MVADLAGRAEARASFAAAAGALLLTEPGSAVVGSDETVARLVRGATPVDFERVFLRSVQPYESIFRSDDGRRGGATAARVADSCAEFDFEEHRSGRWRTAGPDHLGLELRLHAHLIAREGVAWRTDRPDEAARHVEDQRRFLAEHLAWWAEIALDALADEADGTPYGPILEEIRSFVHDEIDMLRPLPVVDAKVATEVGPETRPMGPGRLARHLLSASRSGLWLSSRDIARAAERLGFPWRPMDGRSNLPPLVRAAFDAGEIDELVGPWLAMAEERADTYAARAASQPGAELAWRDHEARVRVTVDLLRQAGQTVGEHDDAELVVRVAGGDPARALALLADAGYEVEVIDPS